MKATTGMAAQPGVKAKPKGRVSTWMTMNDFIQLRQDQRMGVF